MATNILAAQAENAELATTEDPANWLGGYTLPEHARQSILAGSESAKAAAVVEQQRQAFMADNGGNPYGCGEPDHGGYTLPEHARQAILAGSESAKAATAAAAVAEQQRRAFMDNNDGNPYGS